MLVIPLRNRSSSLVRKVRLGQPLTTALHERSTRLTPSRRKTPSTTLAFRSTSNEVLRGRSCYRDAFTRPSTSIEPSMQQVRLAKVQPEMLPIRYGRPVSLRAEDGDYLLVEDDGTLRKMPSTYRNDTRTMLTLFPADPQTSIAGKKHVMRGDSVFIVQGTAPSYARNGAVYADSQRLKTHDATQHPGRSDDKSSIHAVGLMSTTTWRLEMDPTGKCQPQSQINVLDGGALLLVQNETVLCYNLRGRSPTRLKPSTSPQSFLFERHIDDKFITPTLPGFNHVWLVDSKRQTIKNDDPTAGSLISAKWVVHDVELEREKNLYQARRQRRPQTQQHLAPVNLSGKHNICSSLDPKGNTCSTLGLDGPRMPEYDEPCQETTSSAFQVSNHEYQHRAALIISRFFRSICRLDHATDRAQEMIRRRWRGRHPEKYKSPLFELTNYQQLRVLQLYNPHLYGSQHHAPPLTTTATSIRLSRIERMENFKRLKRQQVLERMNQESAILNRTCHQKTQTAISTTLELHEMYQRRPLASCARTNRTAATQ